MKSEYIVLSTLAIWLITMTMNNAGFGNIDLEPDEKLLWRNPNAPYKSMDIPASTDLDYFKYWTVDFHTSGDIPDYGACLGDINNVKADLAKELTGPGPLKRLHNEAVEHEWFSTEDISNICGSDSNCKEKLGGYTSGCKDNEKIISSVYKCDITDSGEGLETACTNSGGQWKENIMIDYKTGDLLDEKDLHTENEELSGLQKAITIIITIIALLLSCGHAFRLGQKTGSAGTKAQMWYPVHLLAILLTLAFSFLFISFILGRVKLSKFKHSISRNEINLKSGDESIPLENLIKKEGNEWELTKYTFSAPLNSSLNDDDNTYLENLTQDVCPLESQHTSGKITCILTEHIPKENLLWSGGLALGVLTFELVTLSVLGFITGELDYLINLPTIGLSAVLALVAGGVTYGFGRTPMIDINKLIKPKDFISPLWTLVLTIFIFSIIISWISGKSKSKLYQYPKKLAAERRVHGGDMGILYTAGDLREIVTLDAPGWKMTILTISIILIIIVAHFAGVNSIYWNKYNAKLNVPVSVTQDDLTQMTCTGNEQSIVRCVDKDTGEHCIPSKPTRTEGGSLECGENCVKQKGCLFVYPQSTAEEEDTINITSYYNEADKKCVDKYPTIMDYCAGNTCTPDSFTNAESICNAQAEGDCNKVSVGKCTNAPRFNAGEGSPAPESVNYACEQMNNHKGQCEAYALRCVAKDPANNSGYYGNVGTDGMRENVKCTDYWDAEHICTNIRASEGSSPLICDWRDDQSICQWTKPVKSTAEVQPNVQRCKSRDTFSPELDPADDNAWDNATYWKDHMLYMQPSPTNHEYQVLYDRIGLDFTTLESSSAIDQKFQTITSIFNHMHNWEVADMAHESAFEGEERASYECGANRYFCPNVDPLDLENLYDIDIATTAARCADGTLLRNEEVLGLLDAGLNSADLLGTGLGLTGNVGSAATTEFAAFLAAVNSSVYEPKDLPCCLSSVTSSSGQTGHQYDRNTKIVYIPNDDSTPCVATNNCALSSLEGRDGILTLENNNEQCGSGLLPEQSDINVNEDLPPGSEHQGYTVRPGTCVDNCEDCPAYSFPPNPGAAHHIKQCRSIRDRLNHRSPRLFACEGNILNIDNTPSHHDIVCGTGQVNKGSDYFWAGPSANQVALRALRMSDNQLITTNPNDAAPDSSLRTHVIAQCCE